MHGLRLEATNEISIGEECRAHIESSQSEPEIIEGKLIVPQVTYRLHKKALRK